MNKDNLLRKVKEAGFKNLDDFVKANLHYLPEEKRKLFYSVIDIEKEFKMVRGDKVRNFNNFKIITMSPLYELSKLALKILSRESRTCNFDYVDYVMLYPENDIRKFVTGDSSRIYTLREKVSGEEFIFAIRNCVMPPGF